MQITQGAARCRQAARCRSGTMRAEQHPCRVSLTGIRALPEPQPSWAGQAPLTPTHQVLPKHGQAEIPGQRGERGADAREQLLEARGARDEVAEGTDAEDAVGVRADDVVVTGGQVVCLHQLRGQKESRERDGGTSFWVVPPCPRAVPSPGNNPESASTRSIAAGTAASCHLQSREETQEMTPSPAQPSPAGSKANAPRDPPASLFPPWCC